MISAAWRILHEHAAMAKYFAPCTSLVIQTRIAFFAPQLLSPILLSRIVSAGMTDCVSLSELQADVAVCPGLPLLRARRPHARGVRVARGVVHLRHLPLPEALRLTIGYCITIVAFSLQPCMMSVVQRMSGFSRVLVVDIYHLFSFFGTVNVWRGVWNLLNFYFLPGSWRFIVKRGLMNVLNKFDNPVASNWISHVLPFLLLVLLNSANSILVRGVYIDAEEEGGQCVEFPIYYLRLLPCTPSLSFSVIQGRTGGRRSRARRRIWRGVGE
ncbi:hypothetical protein FOCC_FOCC016818 [Frankliniella occidentalis]|nr:hypothetical protein FOCC_FOCC016818 [Frankliniella occidentalis]